MPVFSLVHYIRFLNYKINENICLARSVPFFLACSSPANDEKAKQAIVAHVSLTNEIIQPYYDSIYNIRILSNKELSNGEYITALKKRTEERIAEDTEESREGRLFELNIYKEEMDFALLASPPDTADIRKSTESYEKRKRSYDEEELRYATARKLLDSLNTTPVKDPRGQYGQLVKVACSYFRSFTKQVEEDTLWYVISKDGIAHGGGLISDSQLRYGV